MSTILDYVVDDGECSVVVENGDRIEIDLPKNSRPYSANAGGKYDKRR
ncbi:MAG: hypothetical protein AABW51_02145 [Nanoarchaeota archaeon]